MALEAEDVQRFVEATERVQQLQERLGMTSASVGSGNVNLNVGGAGKYGLLVGFVAGGVLVASILIGLWVGFRMNTVDQQVAQTRDEFNQELFEIRADLKGVRAYINKGVAPPIPEKEKKDAK